VAVDVGNSETVVGFVRGVEVSQFFRLTSAGQTGDEVFLRLRDVVAAAGEEPAGLASVLCSVVPSLTAPWRRALERLTGRETLEAGPGTTKSLPIRYKDPSSVGADRLANAIAARALYGKPAIVVDLGTSTNFDCVSRDGAYLGGVLALGVAASAEELFRRAARIPRVELKRPERALGRTTVEAVRSGVVWGSAGLVDAIVRRLAKEMKGKPHVVATGGLAGLIAPECETVEHVDEALTLKGLALIWKENS
jgi:type III pantothenate kinase